MLSRTSRSSTPASFLLCRRNTLQLRSMAKRFADPTVRIQVVHSRASEASNDLARCAGRFGHDPARCAWRALCTQVIIDKVVVHKPLKHARGDRRRPRYFVVFNAAMSWCASISLALHGQTASTLPWQSAVRASSRVCRCCISRIARLACWCSTARRGDDPGVRQRVQHVHCCSIALPVHLPGLMLYYSPLLSVITLCVLFVRCWWQHRHRALSAAPERTILRVRATLRS